MLNVKTGLTARLQPRGFASLGYRPPITVATCRFVHSSVDRGCARPVRDTLYERTVGLL